MKSFRFLLFAPAGFAIIASSTWAQDSTSEKLAANVRSEEAVHGMSPARLASIARNLELAESIARELLGRYQQQTGTALGHPGTRTVGSDPCAA